MHRLQERRSLAPLSREPGDPGRRRRRFAATAVLTVLVVAVDQVTKWLAVAHLSGHSIHLVGPFALALSYNTGVAFSLGSGLTLPIILIVLVLVVIVAWFGRGLPSMASAVAVGLIIGGALGNLADRLFRGHHGGVVDFVYSGFWPTFNVADSCVVCGSILLALSLWRSGRRGARPERPGVSTERPGVSPERPDVSPERPDVSTKRPGDSAAAAARRDAEGAGSGGHEH